MQWKRVVHRGVTFPYEVSDHGEVRRIAGKDCVGRNRKQKKLSPGEVDGYREVCLFVNGARTYVLVHTLVAFAFLPNPPKDYGVGRTQINHVNGTKSDNIWTNLEWNTPLQNKEHAARNGLVSRGASHHKAKITESDVREIRLRRNLGETCNALGREFGLSGTQVGNICRRLSWCHVV